MARDPDLDLIKSLRLLAFDAVSKDKKDADYILRYLFRWYSREFHTPLEAVERLPIEDVLQHFYEVKYENMTAEERDEEAELLCETQAERLAREAKETVDAAEDEAWFQGVKSEADAAKAKDTPTPLDGRYDPDLGRPVAVPVMGERLPQSFQDLAESDPKLKQIPENVEIRFADEGELDLDNWDLCGPPKSRDDD